MTDEEKDKKSGFEKLDEFVDANIDELDRLAERNTKDPSTIDDWKGEEHAQRMDEKEKDENKAHIEYLVKTRDALKRIIIKLKAENARLREALEYGIDDLEDMHSSYKLNAEVFYRNRLIALQGKFRAALQQPSADAQKEN